MSKLILGLVTLAFVLVDVLKSVLAVVIVCWSRDILICLDFDHQDGFETKKILTHLKLSIGSWPKKVYYFL